MKILLTAINAKYIHSNLAIYNLKAYQETYGKTKDVTIVLGEYTINQLVDEIIQDIFLQKPDILAISCYIWNIEYVKLIVTEIHKLYPNMPIWLGGPEASYDGAKLLEQMEELTGIVYGEGEETFTDLVEYYAWGYREHGKISADYENLCDEKEGGDCKSLDEILGLIYRDKTGTVHVNQPRQTIDLSTVPFVYEDVDAFQNKIIYYESSRGCPFSCSYCLSSVDKKLRFRNTKLVEEEIGKFLAHKVKQVKFVDRTFNCNHKHAMAIWTYIKEHDNGITNFHFEVAADLLKEEEIALIGTMRKGLIQLEIGVQSTNIDTIKEIRRVMDFNQVSHVVNQVKEAGNIQQHLDLIVGLPHETKEIFARSFDEVYRLEPEELQLGFLKVLKGSYMYEQRNAYGLVYQSKPPYEILYNNWVSYEDVLELKAIEEMVEVYYNSGQFPNTMKALKERYPSGFQMFAHMAEHYEYQGHNGKKHTRLARFEILHHFLSLVDEDRMELYKDTLLRDLYLRENAKARPGFAKEYNIDKELVRRFFKWEEVNRTTLKHYEDFDARQMSKMTHVEILEGMHVLFDYKNRDPLSHDASTYIIEKLLPEEVDLGESHE